MLIFSNGPSLLLRKCGDNTVISRLVNWEDEATDDHDHVISKAIQICFQVKAYNLGTKKAGYSCRTWVLALERCLNRHFSSNPLQKAAAKVVLGYIKEQGQEDLFSLCDDIAGLWYSTVETTFQIMRNWTHNRREAEIRFEGWRIFPAGENRRVLKEVLADDLITVHLHRKHILTIKKAQEKKAVWWRLSSWSWTNLKNEQPFNEADKPSQQARKWFSYSLKSSDQNPMPFFWQVHDFRRGIIG